jgi:CheY-like chemotaxis protein
LNTVKQNRQGLLSEDFRLLALTVSLRGKRIFLDCRETPFPPVGSRITAVRTTISETEVCPEERAKFKQPPRILLVEDEKPLRDFIVPILLSAGFDCREAATGQSAIDLLRSGLRINLVLSNFLLPEVDGLRLLLYTKQNHPRIPFVFVTYINDAAVRREAVRGGADGFLQKPFEGEQLLAVVRSVLGKA